MGRDAHDRNKLWTRNDDLLNISAHAYRGAAAQATPCISLLCRQTRNTRLVNQPVVLSRAFEAGIAVLSILGKGGAPLEVGCRL